MIRGCVFLENEQAMCRDVLFYLLMHMYLFMDANRNKKTYRRRMWLQGDDYDQVILRQTENECSAPVASFMCEHSSSIFLFFAPSIQFYHFPLKISHHY